MTNEEILEKYGDLEEEDIKKLPKEEQDLIYKAIEEMKAKALKEAEQMKKEFDEMPEEKKKEIQETAKKSIEMAQKIATMPKDEYLAMLLNPDTEDFTEEELKLARELIKKYPDKIAEEIIGLEQQAEIEKYAKKSAEKGFLNVLKRFFRGLFGR